MNKFSLIAVFNKALRHSYIAAMESEESAALHEILLSHHIQSEGVTILIKGALVLDEHILVYGPEKETYIPYGSLISLHAARHLYSRVRRFLERGEAA